MFGRIGVEGFPHQTSRVRRNRIHAARVRRYGFRMAGPAHPIPGWSARRWNEHGMSVRGALHLGGLETVERKPRRVLIPPRKVSDDLITLSSVELYDEGLVVRWKAHSPLWEKPRDGETIEQWGQRTGGSGRAADACGEFELEDDVGTAYENNDVRATREGFGESIFLPTVPSRATKLAVRRGSDWSIELDLTQGKGQTDRL